MSITLNPLPTTFASGTFGVSTDGYIAGAAYPDPASRYKLRAGFIAAAVTGLVYGGIGVSASVQAAASPMLGPQLAIATAIANLTGFAVWDQSAAPVQTPQSPVPLASPGMGMSFYEFGSGACIALPISSANAAALLNGLDNVQLSWDYTNQVVIPFTNSGANAGAIPGPSNGNAKIIDVQIGNSWIVVPNNPGAGQATWNQAGSVVVLQI
jgi:hypothetical protein